MALVDVHTELRVGNLPSEKVTKRDLFHVFHVHGKLAQISIKQAYGFVQYLEASACLAALNAEQGVEIRGRRVRKYTVSSYDRSITHLDRPRNFQAPEKCP